MNIFEGARRIGKLMIGLWIIGWCVAAFVNEPYLSTTYFIYKPGAQPVADKDDSCGSESQSEWKSFEAGDGKTLHVTLCFVAATATDGTSIIPTQLDPATGNISGWQKHSTEVSTYTKAVKERFKLPTDARDGLTKRYWTAKFTDVRNGAMIMLGGVAIMFAFFTVIGWIVRGFLGVPRGHDQRPKSAEGSAKL